MAELARWGNKKWQVSRSNIATIENLSFKYQQVADNNTSTEENKVTNERGKELLPLTFTSTLIQTSKIDVRKEIEEWESLVTKVNYFYLGGKLLGSALQLRKVEVSDVKLDGAGNIIFAKLSFEFKEYEKESTSVKSEVPALSITSSNNDKELKSYQNIQLEFAEKHGIKVGDRVWIVGSYYAGSSSDVLVPNDVKERTHVVSAVSSDDVLLLGFPSGISKYVYAKDVSLA